MRKLEEFIKTNDPTCKLNQLSYHDNDIKRKWDNVKSEKIDDWRKIKSYKDVENLINIFESCVSYPQSDPRARIDYIADSLIAQYKALIGLRKWCNSISSISTFNNAEFPKLTDEEIDKIILRMETIIRKLNN